MHRTFLLALIMAIALAQSTSAQVRVTPAQSKGGLPRYVKYAQPWVDIPDSFRDLAIPDWPVPTDLQQWQNEGRGKVRATLLQCLGEMPPRPSADRVKVLSVEDCGTYTLERFEFPTAWTWSCPASWPSRSSARAKCPSSSACTVIVDRRLNTFPTQSVKVRWAGCL
jgi:hypothetical protein